MKYAIIGTAVVVAGLAIARTMYKRHLISIAKQR